MDVGWAWVSGIVVSLAIIALLVYGYSERQAYWARRAGVVVHVHETQKPDRTIFWRIER